MKIKNRKKVLEARRSYSDTYYKDGRNPVSGHAMHRPGSLKK